MRESMNRAEFMRQLECLLQSIPDAEREEALQYYNDYFDDAGDENEKDVIEALGNPARVAENIKHDLLESGYGEAPLKKAVASDRKLIEYGETESRTQSESASSVALQITDSRPRENGSVDVSIPGTNSVTGSGYSAGVGTGSAYAGGSATPVSTGTYGQSGKSGSSGQSGQSGKSGWPWWAVTLLVVGLVSAGPVIAGIVGTLFGVLAAWFCLILAVGLASLGLFIALVILVSVGIMCMFTDPVSGVALMGGGLFCGGIGILFLMLTVAMAGIVTPAVFRGIAFLFRRRKAK